MATGAPSRTHGLSFSLKLQPMSENSPRTSRTEDVVAARGPVGVVWRWTGGWQEGGGRRSCLPLGGGRGRCTGTGPLDSCISCTVCMVTGDDIDTL